MTESFGIRELNRPPHAGHAAHDLPVDEVPDPSQPHDEFGRYRQRIGDA